MKFKRRKMWLIICSVLSVIAIILFLLWPKVPKVPDSFKNVGELESYLQRATEGGTPPAVSFAVVKNDSIFYSKGFGWADYPKGIEASPETVYHWWSITKIITAVAIMQLQERGKLNIQDPVSKYLPYFKINIPDDLVDPVTILNLLNHSSGMPDPGPKIMGWVHHDWEPSVNQTELVKKVLPDYSKLRFKPGTDVKYTNVGYMVLGAIIEKVTGQTYEDYIRQNILLPLGMNHTDFIYTKAMEPNEAAGTNPVFNIMSPIIPFVGRSYVLKTSKRQVWLKRVYTDQTPSSALLGPVTDLAHFAMAYLNYGEYKGVRILSEESVRAMTYDGYAIYKKEGIESIRRHGIGWSVFKNPDYLTLAHSGGGMGFCTLLEVLPERKEAFILFANDFSFYNKCWDVVNRAVKMNW